MLYSVLTSSAIAFAGLIAAPVNALVAPGSGSELGHLAARHLGGVSPNHHALARRKRNAHKKRQRCQQRPVSADSTPAPQPTSGGNDYVGDDSSGGDNNSNNNNNSGNTYPSNPITTTTQQAQPAPTQPSTQPSNPPATGDGKLILAWPNGAEDSMSNYFTGKAR